MNQSGAKHTVVVVGAGASVAEAKGHRPSRDGEHPPLDATFFERVGRHQSGALLDRIVAHADDLGTPSILSSRLSLEQYLGRLFFEMQNRRTEANIGSYFDLVRLYCDELLSTTNWMIGRKGSLKKLLEGVRARDQRVTVITFNHDLLVENALSQMSERRNGRVWCLSHCYRLGFDQTCANRNESFDESCEGDVDQHIPVLKLHGSVNWVFRTRAKHPPADFVRKSRSLLLWTNKQIPPEADRLRSQGRDWYIWPLVVPPIYEKQGLIKNELEAVWNRAGDALRDATDVIFWGYSFPRADLHARYFFQAAAQANEALRQPVLINPDPAAHAALCETMNPGKVTHFHDVQDYLGDTQT